MATTIVLVIAIMPVHLIIRIRYGLLRLAISLLEGPDRDQLPYAPDLQSRVIERNIACIHIIIESIFSKTHIVAL